MADEEMQDTPTPLSDSASSEDESEGEQVELLVAGRERRKTAGNRYNRDAAVEEAADGEDEDEVALLFADQEGQEDEEFKSEASDEDDMSSSDDDDQGPNAGADDLEGEQAIQKQAKEERARKRKADLALTTTAGLRKRPKIDPTAPKAAPKKPSKKKERVTWMPDPDNANARSSLRKQTIAHREHTLARLKESEAQSKKYKALKEKRDREKARDAPKAMTQADRLAEAERTERRNAKSLNRWEAMEKKRNEEQAAKLAALKNRKLEGPVITWRSGKEKFRGPKYPVPFPKMDFLIEEGPKKRGRKSKAYHEQMANMREAAAHNMMMGYPPPGQSLPPHLQQQLPPMQQSVQQSPQTWLGPPPPPPSSASPQYPAAPPPAAQPPNPQSATGPAPPPYSTSSSPQQLPPAIDTQAVQSTPLPATQTPTNVPPTNVPPTNVPPTNVPPTNVPPTNVPPTNVPPTSGPPPNEPNQSAAHHEPKHDQPAETTTATENSFLHGIHEYASMEKEASNTIDAKQEPPQKPAMEASLESEGVRTKDTESSVDPSPAEPRQDSQPGPDVHMSDTPKVLEEQVQVTQPAQPAPTDSPQTPLGPPPPPAVSVPPASSTSVPVKGPINQPVNESVNGLVNGSAQPGTPQDPQAAPIAPAPPSPEVPMEEGFMTKNLLILDDFDELSSSARQEYGVFFNTKRTAKPSKHSATLCPITLMPARYRDPATGIGYANLYAYKMLQELKEHKFAWSSMLGCYIGRDGAPVARGCPEGFQATKT